MQKKDVNELTVRLEAQLEELPGWSLLSRRDLDSASVVLELAALAETVTIEIQAGASSTAAAEILAERYNHVELPPEQQVEFGEEAYLWRTQEPQTCMLLFRKGGVFVHVNATTEAAIRQIANLVLAVL